MIPDGLCLCGCGEKTNLARQTDDVKGWLRGQPVKYVFGHQRRGKGLRGAITESDYMVEDRGYKSLCWVWLHHRSSQGYGRVGDGTGHQRYAHRVMYEQKVGPIPEGKQLDHLCRVRECVNPSHLEPVTHAQNLRRGVGTKLTSDQVREIREDPRSSYVVAAMFGISPSHAWRIRAREKWADL